MGDTRTKTEGSKTGTCLLRSGRPRQRLEPLDQTSTSSFAGRVRVTGQRGLRHPRGRATQVEDAHQRQGIPASPRSPLGHVHSARRQSTPETTVDCIQSLHRGTGDRHSTESPETGVEAVGDSQKCGLCHTADSPPGGGICPTCYDKTRTASWSLATRPRCPPGANAQHEPARRPGPQARGQRRQMR